MADAKKCDRCGEFYEQRSIVCKAINSTFIRRLNCTLRVYEEFTNAGYYFDLCPVCFHKLMDFLHIEEVDKESDCDEID